MVKIRLRRVGSKKQPSFRLVVADSRAPRDGRFIEEIGFYNPRTEPETLRIKEERALHWLSVGAQPTDSAERLLKTRGTFARFERLREGESLEALLAEAEAAEEAEVEAEAEIEEAAETEQEDTEAPVAETEPGEASGTEEAELQDLESEEPTAANGAEEAAESQETEEAPEEDRPGE